MDRQIVTLHNGVMLDGRDETLGGIVITIYLKDKNGDIMLCTATGVPTADTAGFAKGCLLIDEDVADGSKGLYQNQGTKLLSDFDIVGDIASADIANGAVTLAKLASGISASHIIKFFKLGSTITDTTLAGVAVGDLVVSILADGTVTVGTVATADTLPADPADTTYVIVFRATA